MITLTKHEKESLDRLEAFLSNESLAYWYFTTFITAGLLPIPYEVPQDIKNLRKLVRKLKNGT